MNDILIIGMLLSEASAIVALVVVAREKYNKLDELENRIKSLESK